MASLTTETRRLARLLSKYERTVRTAFADYVRYTRSSFAIRYLADLIQANRLEEALRIVDSHVVRLGNVVPRLFQDVATDEAARLGRILDPSRAAVAVTFDPTARRAAELMRRNRLGFIQGFTGQQRDATRVALTRALQSGAGPRAAALAFRDSIGLTTPQLRAVWNYRALLEMSSNQALQRELRDRRFDSTVRSATPEDPLTDAQVSRMTERYQERMLTMRAETISRTETQRALNQGRQEALLQSVEQLRIDPRMVERVWHAVDDHRTRWSHADMDGQVVGLSEPFVSGRGFSLMHPGDPTAPPEETINCRCTVTHRILGTEEEAQPDEPEGGGDERAE